MTSPPGKRPRLHSGSPEQPVPEVVRLQKSSFLASLGRPISPPPGSRSTSTIDVDTQPEDLYYSYSGSRRDIEKRSLEPEKAGYGSESIVRGSKQPRPNKISVEGITAKSYEQRLPHTVSSPFKLTKIQDLPNSQNVDSVSLHDILGNPLIREAWIFNYCFDVNWTMQHFDADVRNSISVKIVHGSWKKEDKNRIAIEEACKLWGNVTSMRAYLPDAFGTHHTKMIVLLRHDECAEIVIHTANMLKGDWTHATQAAWRSPLLSMNKGMSDAGSSWGPIGYGSRFKHDFLAYLDAYGKICVPLMEEIQKYNFSPVRGALIGSVPSTFKNVQNSTANLWGWPMLKRALKIARAGKSDSSGHIVSQCSSIATLKAGWLEGTLFEAMTPSTSFFAGIPKTGAETKFSIIFPTATDVANSLDGYGGGGSIHTKIQSAAHLKQVNALHPYFCRWKNAEAGKNSGRHLAAPHIKTYIKFRSTPSAAMPAPPIDWALLTSANLSVQAWGSEPRVPKGTARKNTNPAEAEVYVQSYELGILVWPELFADNNQTAKMVPVFRKDLPEPDDRGDGLDVLVGLRMPYDLPLTPYSEGELPWSPNVQHRESDRYGRTWPPDQSWCE